MASEINPSLTPTKSLSNFRFWCQKVLPLVYDDSLSYYEVLGKMVAQLNDVIDDVNADTENVLTLKDAFLALQTYVNEFFDDIDQLASYAERAEAAQAGANQSAINAATSASNASASSLAAMNARDAAVTAKQAAEESASAASTAATNATTKANEAAQSATAAQTAQASASQSATSASGSALNASASATAAQQSFTLADAARAAAQSAANDAESAAELIDMDATSSDVGKALIVKTVEGGKVSAYEFGEAGGGGGSSPTITNTVSGTIVSFDDGIEDSKVKKLVANIDAMQSGTGNPAPDNIRPISGWTSCNIYHSGEDTSNPSVIQISFPSEVGTVYGGNLTINEDGSGKITVTNRTVTFNGNSNEIWSEYSTHGFSISLPLMEAQQRGSGLCNRFKVLGANDGSISTGFGVILGLSNKIAYFIGIKTNITEITDSTTWRAWLAENTVTIVYLLENPITYTLTAQQVITLLRGENNIWADTGNIEVTYYADSKSYIDDQNALVKALIAPVLDSMIADTALVKNDFRIVDNTLYRATTTIASGATLTVGTNVVATTLAEVIKPLLT